MDIRDLWQNQPVEGRVSIEEIRKRAHRLEQENRWSVATGIVIALFLMAGFGTYFVRAHDPWARTGWGLLTLWTIYAPYFFFRNLWPRGDAAQLAPSACVAFYRAELERRRAYARRVWPGLLAPLFLALAVVLVPPLLGAFQHPALLAKAAPFFILLTIWAVLFAILKRRGKRKVRTELEMLDEFERGGSARRD